MKFKDVNQVRCIKIEGNIILVKDKEIKDKCRHYFEKLLNEDFTKELHGSKVERSHGSISTIHKSEVKIALKRIQKGKELKPDEILIEV